MTSSRFLYIKALLLISTVFSASLKAMQPTTINKPIQIDLEKTTENVEQIEKLFQDQIEMFKNDPQLEKISLKDINFELIRIDKSNVTITKMSKDQEELFKKIINKQHNQINGRERFCWFILGSIATGIILFPAICSGGKALIYVSLAIGFIIGKAV